VAPAHAVAEGLARATGRTPSLCRARVRTILHGHRYDGSPTTRELGLSYTPVAETFRRTIEWALAAGLVNRPLDLTRTTQGGERRSIRAEMWGTALLARLEDLEALRHAAISS
jgi:hypothetical protein